MRHLERGATLVEVLVAIGLTALMLPTLATALITSHAGRATAQQQLKATALVRETTEAVRAARAQDWDKVATNGTYHPTITGDTWTLASGPETIDGFTRQLVIDDAQRDGTGTLVADSGTADPNTKHITVTVSWSTPYNGSTMADFYITHWQNDVSWAMPGSAVLALPVQRNYST